ncbi:hypothetical protein ACVGXP_11500, partial [Enterobacter hormaechei]
GPPHHNTKTRCHPHRARTSKKKEPQTPQHTLAQTWLGPPETPQKQKKKTDKYKQMKKTTLKLYVFKKLSWPPNSNTLYIGGGRII